MPVLKQPPDEPNGTDLGGSQSESSYRVAFLMFHYFEWVGTFETSTSGNRSVISSRSCDVKVNVRVLSRTCCDCERRPEEMMGATLY
jgi:hypothetical protein